MKTDISNKRGKDYDEECYSKYECLNGTIEQTGVEHFIRLIAHLVSKSGVKSVLDVGCGPGYIARVLDTNIRYTGVDWSSVAIKYARIYSNRNFFISDAYKYMDKTQIQKFDMFLFIEILEHLEDDLKLLSYVPYGKRVILSVPDYWSGGHVRIFESTQDVEQRYSMINGTIIPTYLSSGKLIWVLDGVKIE